MKTAVSYAQLLIVSIVSSLLTAALVVGCQGASAQAQFAHSTGEISHTPSSGSLQVLQTYLDTLEASQATTDGAQDASHNLLSADVGLLSNDVASLTTDVGSLSNEVATVSGDLGTVSAAVGALSQLTTSDTTSIVAAINEVANRQRLAAVYHDSVVGGTDISSTSFTTLPISVPFEKRDDNSLLVVEYYDQFTMQGIMSNAVNLTAILRAEVPGAALTEETRFFLMSESLVLGQTPQTDVRIESPRLLRFVFDNVPAGTQQIDFSASVTSTHPTPISALIRVGGIGQASVLVWELQAP